MTTHRLRVQEPYFDVLLDGTKTFEVRRNDRAFQRGDVLDLYEWTPDRCGYGPRCTSDHPCRNYTGRNVTREVTFVYSGDPRFGGVEPGFVVLALAAPSPVEDPR